MAYLPRLRRRRDKEEEEEEEPKIVEKKEFLLIETVNLHYGENRRKHNSDEYENRDLLVVRRGDSVKITVQCNRKPEGREEIWFRLAYGEIPKLSKGTLVEVTSSKKREVDADWWIEEEKSDTESITYHLHIPPTAPVARYNLTVDSWVIENSKYVKKSSWPKPKTEKVGVVVLFNPWCRDDQVFLEEEEERQEYVLNDDGRLWVGSPETSRFWAFAQFDEDCYEAALDVMGYFCFESRSDSALICRYFSHLVAKLILQGRWDNRYDPFSRPNDWTGSEKILKTFRSKMKNEDEDATVKYGQCWVFSAVSTTLCRALGIPCRSVTNFESAHDKDQSISIDKHFDVKGKPLEFLNHDEVWNFHVWNEAWMKRTDLPAGYDGWQAFDATHQEISDLGGQFACGPCPLSAIKKGELHIPFDAKFIFSEVNGDKCDWVKNYLGKFDLVKVEHSAIGTAIMTKDIGRWNHQGVDIRSLYKYEDGSVEEAQVLNRVYGHSSKRNKLLATRVENKEVVYRFEVSPAKTVKAGDNIIASLFMENRCEKQIELQVTMTVGAFFYFGRPMSENVEMFSHKVTLQPGQRLTEKVKVKPDKYLNFVKDDAQLRFYCVAKDSDDSASASFVESKQINLDLPEVEIEPIGKTKVKSGENLNLKLKFRNPLKETLTDVEFTVEGAGMRQRSFKPGEDLAPGCTVIQEVKVQPRRRGQREIVAVFRSNEMSSQSASINVEVE